MENNLTLHIKNFNNKVKVMNQTNTRELVLTKVEAQNLLSDILDLLTQIAELAKVDNKEQNSTVNVEFDGGKF